MRYHLVRGSMDLVCVASPIHTFPIRTFADRLFREEYLTESAVAQNMEQRSPRQQLKSLNRICCIGVGWVGSCQLWLRMRSKSTTYISRDTTKHIQGVLAVCITQSKRSPTPSIRFASRVDARASSLPFVFLQSAKFVISPVAFSKNFSETPRLQ